MTDRIPEPSHDGSTGRPTDDELLCRRVRDELAWHFLIDESQIDVEVTDRVVTLIGSVGSYAEKKVAEVAAQAVDGVHDLVNVIDVKRAQDIHPSDPELKAIVDQVLTWDALVHEADLTVTVVDGLVALTGTTSTRVQAEQAERAIAHLAGVRDVINRIEVRSPTPSPPDVRRAIAEALDRRTTDRRAAEIDVSVDGSIVSLTGAVASPMERRAIVDAVGHAPGITEVRDRLWVEAAAPAPRGRSGPGAGPVSGAPDR